MEKLTINQLLELITEVSKRLSRLHQIQNSCTVRETSYFGQEQQNRKEVVPQYDVKAVDLKIVELETFLFKAKAAIKQANAATKVDLDVKIDSLLAPLQ